MWKTTSSRFETLDRRIREVEHTVEDLSRKLSAALLDIEDTQDKARRMLNRANAQRRWLEAREGGGNGETAPTTVDELNELIREGRYKP